jgi:RNA polymerase sigma-70 factor (family 1)
MRFQMSKISLEDESVILQLLIDGDTIAFRNIYNIYYHPLYHFAYRFVKDNEQVEDILAESFVVLWKKKEEFESFKGLISYLYTIVRNACFDHLKKTKRRNASDNEFAYLFEDGKNSEINDAIKTDLIQYSLIEGSKLPSQMRKIFHMLYIEGFSAVEIAEKLHLSIYTVKAQKFNAIRRVRNNLIKKGLLGWLM